MEVKRLSDIHQEKNILTIDNSRRQFKTANKSADDKVKRTRFRELHLIPIT